MKFLNQRMMSSAIVVSLVTVTIATAPAQQAAQNVSDSHAQAAPPLAAKTRSKSLKKQGQGSAKVAARSTSTQTLPTVVVTGNVPLPATDGYQPLTTSLGTKTAAAIHDLPLSIQTVSSQVIQDRDIQQVDQFTDSVSGVERINNFPGNTGYLIRGFFENFDGLRNGFRDSSGFQDIANVDHIEVLKGPSAALYGGNITGGGVVNVVTKEPLDHEQSEIDFTAGSYDFYRTQIDSTGPLDKDHTLLYRIVGDYENSGSFKNYEGTESEFVAPTLTWHPTPEDTLLVGGEWEHSRYYFDGDLPLDQAFTREPFSFSDQEPGGKGSSNDLYRVNYSYDHKFDQWAFHQGFYAGEVDYNIGPERVYITNLEPDGVTLDRIASEGPQSNENYELVNELSGLEQLGPSTHHLLFGIDIYRENYEIVNNFAELPPLNILDPQNSGSPGPFSPAISGKLFGEAIGLYAQDQIDITSQVKILAGTRLDITQSSGTDRLAETKTRVDTRNFSPRAGIAYQPIKETSLYFSWGESFIPNYYSLSATGQTFPPTQSDQFEAGVKQTFLDGHFSTTAAVYQITRNHVLEADPANPIYSIAGGRQRSQGFEFDAAGRLLPGLDLISSYAYTAAVVTQDDRLPVGNELADVPRNSGSIFAKYTLQDTVFKGLGVGGGLTVQSTRQATLPNTFTLPSYARLDAVISYKRGAWEGSVNFNNLTNVKYYDSDGISLLRTNPPFEVLGTVRWRF